jgi:hypothetical protein
MRAVCEGAWRFLNGCVCVWGGGAGDAVPMCRLLQTILRLRACTDAAQWEGGTPAPARYQPHTALLCTTGIRPRAVPVSCRRTFEIGFVGCSLAVWSGRGQIDIDRVWSFVLQKWVTQQVMMDPPLLLSPRTGTRDCVSQTAANEQPTFAHIFPRTVKRGNWRHTGRAESTSG